MSPTIVDRLHSEFQQLVAVLEKAAEPSLQSTADDTFRKVLLISAASHFERLVTETVLDFVRASSSGNERVVEFVRQKGLDRQYHTLFDWKEPNANAFFRLFGDAFRAQMVLRLKTETDLADSIRAFMELGRERNRLIHGDLGQFTLEKTAEEIFKLYQRAAVFVDELPRTLSGVGTPSAHGA